MKVRAIAIPILLISIIFIFPFYWLVVSAFKTRAQIFTIPPQFLPSPVVMENFQNLVESTVMVRAFWNSSVVAVGHVALALVLCSMAGYAFAKYKNAPGINVLFALVMGTMMIPAAVTMIPVFVVLSEIRLVNTHWAMIVPGAANAFGIFWMRQYISANVPDDLIASARIDGCSEFGIYWRIVMPVCAPALGALGILVLIGIWNNLLWAFIVMRTEDMYTLPLLIYLLQGELRTPYGMVMACGVITTLPLILGFLFFQRSFVRGMTAGAIKG
jgi:ABC-type glycerol-3-phosphate transport system permease component